MTFVVSHGTGCWELCVLLSGRILEIIVLDALRAFWEMWSPTHTELALWHMLLLSLLLDNTTASNTGKGTLANHLQSRLDGAEWGKEWL